MNRDEEISLYGKRAARTIARFRLDDESARKLADEKVQQWTPWAYRYANLYIRQHRKAAAAIRLAGHTIEDIHQAALEGMTRASRVHIEENGAFSAYSVWYMRKEIQRLARLRSVKANISMFVDPRYTDESPSQSLIQSEQSEVLQAWLSEIPELYRDILTDHFGGILQNETVARLKLSKRTIHKYRGQALAWLKFFAGVGPEPDRLLPGMRYKGGKHA